ncbi:hypothetical protein Tco_1466659 [Tanacetum coccineum]
MASFSCSVFDSSENETAKSTEEPNAIQFLGPPKMLKKIFKMVKLGCCFLQLQAQPFKRERKTQLFKESLEQQRKLNEEKFEEFKEEMNEETNDNQAEALTQLKQQHANPHSV